MVVALHTDGSDMQYMQQNHMNSTANVLQAYLNTQPSSLKPLMTSKTCRVLQRHCGRQTQVCVVEKKAIFVLFFWGGQQ